MRPASCRSGARSVPPKAGSTSCGQHNQLVPVVARAEGRRHPRLAVHRAPIRRQIETAARSRRAGDRDPHRRLVRGGRRWARRRWRTPSCERIARGRALRAGSSGSKSMPATASIYATAETIAALPEIVELNIGHFLVGEAIFGGLAETVTGDARRDGPRPRAGAERCHDPRHRLRPHRHPPHREGDRAARRALPRAHLHRRRARARRAPRQARRDLRQALRRQGGLRQGARHRHARRRVVARHGRRQPAVRAARPCSSPAARCSGSPSSRRRATRRASTSPSPTSIRWRRPS